MLRFVPLWQVDIDRPEKIAAPAAKFHKEHLSANEFVTLSPGDLAITAPRVLRPEIGFLLNLTWYLDIRWIIGSENALQHHGETVTREYLAVLGNASQVD